MFFRAVDPRSIGAALRRLLAPQCALCGLEHGDPVCAACRTDFFADARPRCARCAIVLPASAAAAALCRRCIGALPSYDATIALADYAPPVDGLVKALKYGHRLELARVLGTLLGERVRASIGAGALREMLVVPVPLAFERQSERGFNQSAEIARALAGSGFARATTDVLVRIRHAAPQESLDLEMRRRNLRGAFVVPREAEPRVRGRTIALVDDVMTSGSTLDAAAAALKHAGAAHVTNLVVARTP